MPWLSNTIEIDIEASNSYDDTFSPNAAAGSLHNSPSPNAGSGILPIDETLELTSLESGFKLHGSVQMFSQDEMAALKSAIVSPIALPPKFGSDLIDYPASDP